jgi:arylsulfatase A-like enzyme
MTSLENLPQLIVALTLGLLATVLPAAESGPTRPNLVFILADDLGWADTTLFGHTNFYKTPNLERLAQRGMTFTRAYSASPLCSPTRSSILTGLSPARTGITAANCHLPHVILKATAGAKAPAGNKSIEPTPVTRLNTTSFTLAEAMKQAGYATGHFGKWHLGPEPYSPLEQGFDVDLPHWAGPGPAGSYVAPWKFKGFDADPGEPHQHIEDRMAKEAVAFMEKHRSEPFFLNYWMFSVHAPFDAKKPLIEQYRATVDPTDPQRSPTYAAMIESMDDAVGTLLDTLDRLEIADNTLIIFFSDNGGDMYNEVDGTTPTSNAPLRGGKATVYEGGVRVPCIVAYPGVVAPATRNDTIVQSSDFYPTILDLFGMKPQPDQYFDGVSIAPALEGRSLSRDAIFTYFPHSPPVPDWLPPAVTVHQGEWKLIRIFFGGENGGHRWKLFNLKDDLGEQNDLTAKEPARVEAMDVLIEEFLAETGAVQPVPNPAFSPASYHPEDEGKAKPRSEGKPNAKRATTPKAGKKTRRSEF